GRGRRIGRTGQSRRAARLGRVASLVLGGFPAGSGVPAWAVSPPGSTESQVLGCVSPLACWTRRVVDLCVRQLLTRDTDPRLGAGPASTGWLVVCPANSLALAASR